VAHSFCWQAHLKPGDLSARQDDDFSIPDNVRIEQMVKSQYSGIRDLDTRAWVDTLSNKPPASVHQIMEHIAKHPESSADALKMIDEMFEQPEKPEVPLPVAPTGWIVDWLKDDEDLEQYTGDFMNQKILTKDDVLADPPWDCSILKDVLGVDKLGHQKKLLIKIEQLRQQ
jgi:hypothetical protein